MVQPYNITDTATAWKNSNSVLSERSDFYIVDKLSCFINAYLDIAFNRWDIATEVYEQVY